MNNVSTDSTNMKTFSCIFQAIFGYKIHKFNMINHYLPSQNMCLKTAMIFSMRFFYEFVTIPSQITRGRSHDNDSVDKWTRSGVWALFLFDMKSRLSLRDQCWHREHVKGPEPACRWERTMSTREQRSWGGYISLLPTGDNSIWSVCVCVLIWAECVFKA